MRDPDGLIKRWSPSNGSGGELVEHAAQIEPSIEAPSELGEGTRNARRADRVASSSDCSLQEPALSHDGVVAAAAAGTDESVGPAPRFQRDLASPFRAVAPLELRKAQGLLELDWVA